MRSDEKKRAGDKTRLVSFLKKIPLFSDLSDHGVRRVLSICSKFTLDEGRILCGLGEESNIMYILLYGKLAVKISDSAPVAIIDPISTIGEMGVFTGEPRTATVQAIQNSGLLSLKKPELNVLIRKDTDFGVKIMSKIIKILAKRICEDDKKIDLIQKYLISQEEQNLVEKIYNDVDIET